MANMGRALSNFAMSLNLFFAISRHTILLQIQGGYKSLKKTLYSKSRNTETINKLVICAYLPK